MSNGTGEMRVPTFLTGIVSKHQGVDFCMDGADYRLQTLAGVARLKPNNDDARKRLDGFIGKRITVGGYPTWGPECGYLSVYYAAPPEEVYSSLNQTF